MEDWSAILCQISSYKHMLDQVNEEIEASIEKTRLIESEIVKCSEIEKGYLMREMELTNMVSIANFELNDLALLKASTRKSLDMMESETRLLKLKSEELAKDISKKREKFIAACTNFQREIAAGENEELNDLLLEKEKLETEKSKLNAKIDALRTSTNEFLGDILGELENSNLTLEIEIECRDSENFQLLKEVDELKVLLHSIMRTQHPQGVEIPLNL